MNTYLLSICFLLVCFGLYASLTIDPLYPIPDQFTAEATNHTINLNYTNIYDNKTYMDIVTAAKTYQKPTRNLDFGITVSNTCLVMHKNNITTDCPTYESIMVLFPDTSNHDVSGKFIFKDNMIQRDKPQFKNSYNWYTFLGHETVLFIDPDTYTQKEIGMITIHPQLGLYKINKMSGKVEDNKRYLGTGRYIEDCRNAAIDGKNWIFLLGDTINYLRNNCEAQYTQFNSTIEYQAKLTDHDITTSNKWLHETFIEWVKENCLYEYDKC